MLMHHMQIDTYDTCTITYEIIFVMFLNNKNFIIAIQNFIDYIGHGAINLILFIPFWERQ